MVVYPIIYMVLYIPGGCLGFLNHQQLQRNMEMMEDEDVAGEIIAAFCRRLVT